MNPYMNIVTLGVSDLVAATAFYEHGLGLPKMAFEGDISFFTLQGTWLALHPWEALAEDAKVDPKSSGFRGITLAHVVADEAAVLALLEQAEAAGGRIIKPAERAQLGWVFRVFYGS